MPSLTTRCNISITWLPYSSTIVYNVWSDLVMVVPSKPIEFRTVVSLIIHDSCLVTKIMSLAYAYVSSVVATDLRLLFVILACNDVGTTVVVLESAISDRCNRVNPDHHQHPLQTLGSCPFGLVMG